MSGDEPTQIDEPRARAVVEGGGDLIGAAAGGAIGLVGGPFGAVGGAMAGVAISRSLQAVGSEVLERVLAHRAKGRVEAAGQVIAADTNALMASGLSVRTDAFFRADGTRVSTADEVLEGLLLYAADSYEERKIRHLAAVFPIVATDENVNPADAHWVSRTVHRLSWRQLGVVAVLINGPQDSDSPDGRVAAPLSASPGLQEEVQELAEMGLIAVGGSSGMVRAGGTWSTVSSIWHVPPATWGLTAAGQLLAASARLVEVDATFQHQLCKEIGLTTPPS